MAPALEERELRHRLGYAATRMSSGMDGPHGHPHPGAPRERESRDSGIDSEELPPGPQVPGVIDTEYLSLKTSINLPLTDSDGALISTGTGKLNCQLSRKSCMRRTPSLPLCPPL